MLKMLTMAAALTLAATGATAAETTNVDKSFVLKDGTTVYVFKDGKMAMEDKLGRTVTMKPGQVMQTTDGQSLVMIGNEVARLDWIRKTGLGGGN